MTYFTAKQIYERLHPDLKEEFLKLPSLSLDGNDLQKMRTEIDELIKTTGLPHDSKVKVYDQFIQNSDGTKLRLRIYDPIVRTRNAPGILWIHGGGFIMGTPEESEERYLRFALELAAVVIAVDYRLAPEHPYPAAIQDCYSALNWLFENAPTLGVNRDKFAVVGASAGAGLAASLSIMTRDKKGPKIAFQMLLYPMLDDRGITESSNMTLDDRLWTKKLDKIAWNHYIGHVKEEDRNSYMAPAREKNLSALPPTYSFIGELDIFLDDTIIFVQRLLQAGVPTEFHIYPGCIHAFESFIPNAPISVKATIDMLGALRKALS